MEEPSVNKALENASVDVSLLKIGIIGALGVVFALATGYFLNLFLNSGQNLDTFSLIVDLLASVIFFLTVFVLQTIFIKSNSIVSGIFLLESLAMVLPFVGNFSIYLLSAFAALTFFFGVATARGRQEIDNQVKVHFFRIEERIIPHILTALSILISLLYLSNLGADQNFISKKSIAALIKPAEPIVQKLVLPDFSLKMTVYQMVDAILTQKAAQQLGVSLKEVPVSLKAEAIDKSLAELQLAAANYGIAFRSSDTLVDVVYNYISSLVRKIPEAFRPIIPISFFLLIFLTVKGIGALLNWPAEIFIYLIYEILLALGFARLALESRTREIVVLS